MKSGRSNTRDKSMKNVAKGTRYNGTQKQK